MRHVLTLAIALCSIGVSAQNNGNSSRYIEYQEYQINKNYSDSLVAFQQQQKTDETEAGDEVSDGRLYPLFAPFTFYHTPARKALRLSNRNTGVDP